LNGNIRNIPDTLSDGMHFLDCFISTLENIVDNKMGPLWHDKNRQLVRDGVSRLKLLDKEWRRLKHDSEEHQLKLINTKIARVQQLISQYMMLLEGSKSLVKEEIGRINKAKLIRGYRFGELIRVSSGQLC
jgi:hypothetical protein